MIIIFANNKIFNFFLPEETILDACIIGISTSSNKVYVNKTYVFQFQYHQTLYFFFFNQLLHTIVKKKNYFIMIHFSHLN